MLKKIALGALLAGLVAVLVWGAVIRTNARGGESAGEAGRFGRVTEPAMADAPARGDGGRWSATSQGAAAATGRGNGRRLQGDAQEQVPSQPGDVPQADVQPDDWRTIQGIVAGATGDLVEIRAASGEVIPLEGQPLRYALEQGLDLAVGDAVALSGYDEAGEFKIGRVTCPDDGTSVTLRDASGRPGWAGRGQGR